MVPPPEELYEIKKIINTDKKHKLSDTSVEKWVAICIERPISDKISEFYVSSW